MLQIRKLRSLIALGLFVGVGFNVPAVWADKHSEDGAKTSPASLINSDIALRFAHAVAQAVAASPAPTEPMVTKVIPVRHVAPDKVASLFFKFGSMRVRSSCALGLITAYGPASSIAVLEEAVRAVDIPGQTGEEVSAEAEITAYLLGTADEEDSSAKLPGLLQPVVRELREAFPYPGYRLLEIFTVRVRPSRGAKIYGVISNSSVGRNPTYEFSVTTGSISRIGDRRVIALDEINLNLRWPHVDNPESPNQYRYVDAWINSGVTIQDGQTVVIGKAGVPGKNRGLFLIIRARVVE